MKLTPPGSTETGPNPASRASSARAVSWPGGAARKISKGAGWLNAGSQHRRHDLIGRAVAVVKGLDIDDHLLAHLDPSLDRRRSHMRQEHHVLQFTQARVDLGPVLVDIEPRPGDLSCAEHPRERVLVDHLAAAGIHDHRLWLHQFQPPRIHQVKGRRGMRAVYAQHIHPRHHLIEALPIGGLMLLLDLGTQPATVVVMHLHAEGRRSLRHRLTDPAHAEDPQTPPGHTATQKSRWRPALPLP